MNTRKWTIIGTLIVLVALVTLAMPLGLTQAQGPAPSAVEQAITGVGDYIPIQGRLTDSEGNPPPTADYDLRFRLYEHSSGGTPICTDTELVGVVDGLFSSYIHGCADVLHGQGVWLSVEIVGDGEMTPRQALYPVPYAMTLRPGAVISDTRDVVLTLRSTGTGDADALVAYAGDDGEAVTAHSPNGAAIFAWSDSYIGVQGYSLETANHPGIFGCSAPDNPTCDAYRDARASGVVGYSSNDIGVAGYGLSGVLGLTEEVNGVGVSAINQGNGIALIANANSSDPANHSNPTLYLVQQDDDGDFVVGANQLWMTRYWRVDRTGKGFFNGGTQTGGADFAEQIAVAGDEATYEPGDVVVISTRADRTVERSGAAFATTVIGVYSTEPGVLAGALDTNDPVGGIPVAITGIVPCKVSAENGPIHRGDLLVTAATPGHAMRAGGNPPQGTVLGKALGELPEGFGVILVLVTMQ
jgi:hypothetical protein